MNRYRWDLEMQRIQIKYFLFNCLSICFIYATPWLNICLESRHVIPVTTGSTKTAQILALHLLTARIFNAQVRKLNMSSAKPNIRSGN